MQKSSIYVMITVLMSILIITIMSSCFKVVTKQQLKIISGSGSGEEFLSTIPMLYEKEIRPMVQKTAVEYQEFRQLVDNNFDEACEKIGYRESNAFQCNFSVAVRGEVISLNTKSRAGYALIQPQDATLAPMKVALGPVIQGTGVRDIYRGISYQDIGDQTLFGEIADIINKNVVSDISANMPVLGDMIVVYGVVSLWDKRGKSVVVPVLIKKNE